MIDKQEVIEKLEQERQFAADINLPQMALGIAQAIKVIEGIEEQSLELEIDFDEMREIEYSCIEDEEEI